MVIYQIETSKIDYFMLRHSLKFIRDMSISLFIFMLIIGLGTELKVPFIILSKIWAYVLIFYIVLFFFSFVQQNLHLAKRFIISEDTMYQIQDSGATNSYNEFMLKRVERKSGQKRDQEIPFSSIKSIKIDKNKIQVKSLDFNHWNANGKIEIPREVNDYSQAVKHLRQIANDHKEIELVDKIL